MVFYLNLYQRTTKQSDVCVVALEENYDSSWEPTASAVILKNQRLSLEALALLFDTSKHIDG